MLKPHRTRALFAIGLVLSVALGACGGRAGHPGASTPNAAVRSAFGPGPAGSTSGSAASPSSQASNVATPTPRGDPKTGSASLQEPQADALKFGAAPAYAEITAAAIRGASRSVTFRLTVAANLPDRTADAQTTMKAGFRVKVGESPYVLTASLSSTGWSSSATKDGKRVTFSGTMTPKGATLTFVVPWTFFGGAQTFTWTGFSAWDQTAPTTRFYSVDIIPNAGEAPYPQG